MGTNGCERCGYQLPANQARCRSESACERRAAAAGGTPAPAPAVQAAPATHAPAAVQAKALIAGYVDPMKAADLKPETDWGTDKPFARLGRFFGEQYAMEPKLDGCRVQVILGETSNVIASGRTADRDRTRNFPHFAQATIPGLGGTVIDGELIANGDRADGMLTTTTALINSNPDHAATLQKFAGPARFYAFDVVAVMGEDVTGRSYDERRQLLAQVVAGWQQRFPNLPVHLVPTLPSSAATIARAIADGAEGVIIKKRDGSYHAGERNAGWFKVKTMTTADAFVVGWKPGQGSNANLVGSLELAVYKDGEAVSIGHAGNMTVKFRRDLTAPDGTLREEWYGRVIEFAGQGVGPNGKIRHCLLQRVRLDKDPAGCQADQLNPFPRV
jgi:ATP-dependent DNA ligase